MVRMVVRCAQKAGTATVACGTDQVTTMDVVRKKQTKESKTKQERGHTPVEHQCLKQVHNNNNR